MRVNFTSGIKIKIVSEIPIGCGMGSSAAIIVSLLVALFNFFKIETTNELFPLAQEIENLQHGKSSGLDLYLAAHGGLVLFESNNVTRYPMPLFPFTLINTGKPKNSTGECIAYAKSSLQKKELLQRFADATLGLAKALRENDLITLQEKVQANHFLLKEIGLAPKKVSDFIQEIGSHGYVAKISGAGTISGDQAGMIIAWGDIFVDDLIKKFGFSKIIAYGENDGAKII